ncbi:radical SAM protein [Blautia liquoris]|uniref:Radical SAM protein n=1 Tax=Blautia liquoris TaxID=2779518 RepID=A0A7M2RF65_9FIRM|nr:radical SAM protein [Blautia liquoris]QOV18985.1 radical SAM protein [Blautia liquoris]
MKSLNTFMENGIKNIVETAARFYMGNFKGQVFLHHLVSSLREHAKIRDDYEKEGVHIPPFLISSITNNCNLHCAGCYARANGNCSDRRVEIMDKKDWSKVFAEADKLGISFILLAGGEPLIRKDVIKLAGQCENMVFPIFTNGTMINDEYIELFDSHRNLVPVLSIEGNAVETDRRRGEGIAEKVTQVILKLKKRGILFGMSITVTSENKDEVTDQKYTTALREQGCGLIFYVEYVPAEKGTEYLVLDEDDQEDLRMRINALRSNKKNKGIIMLSFPGDEESMGGCLAAGRGFFHINASGGAEPCPFSPYSELNVKEQSIVEVLKSLFFREVRKISAAEVDKHDGGCTLFPFKEDVEALTKTE